MIDYKLFGGFGNRRTDRLTDGQTKERTDISRLKILILVYLSDDSKILILSGSHGSEDGISGLTDKAPKNVDEGFGFYLQDCQLLGIKPGPNKRSQRLPLRNWNGVPDITKPAEKNERYFWNSLLQDMDIRVCNICYYNGQQDKLIQDIQQGSYLEQL